MFPTFFTWLLTFSSISIICCWHSCCSSLILWCSHSSSFCFSLLVSHSLTISIKSFCYQAIYSYGLPTPMVQPMYCPLHFHHRCFLLQFHPTSWSVKIITSLGTTPAILCSICALILPVNPSIGNGLPLDCITLNRSTNGWSLWSPGQRSSLSSTLTVSFISFSSAIINLSNPFTTLFFNMAFLKCALMFYHWSSTKMLHPWLQLNNVKKILTNFNTFS